MLLFEKRQVFRGEPKGKYPGREDPDRDSDFRQRWKVMDLVHKGWYVVQRVRMFDGEPTDVEAVEDHAEQGDERA